MSCDSRTYPGVSPAVRECFQHNALARGIEWQGDLRKGTFTYKEGPIVVRTRYSYDPESKELVLEVVDKPFVATCKRLYKEFLGGLVACGYEP